MKIEDIERLVRLLDQSSLTCLKYETGTEKLKLSKIQEAVVAQMPAGISVPAASSVSAKPATSGSECKSEIETLQTAADESIEEVKSTYVGTVSLHEEGSDKPYILPGSRVRKGQCVCQIEAMKMYNSIVSPVDGEVISVEVENGSIVEYGTVIARIRKDGV